MGRSLRALELSRELGHFYGGETCLKTFVAALESGAIDGLLEGVACEHTENDGQTGVHLRELQSPRGFGANVIVVSRLAAQDATNSDERIETAGGGQLFCRER